MALRYTITITGTSDDMAGVASDVKVLSALLRERSPGKRPPRVTLLSQSQVDATLTDADAPMALADAPDKITAAVTAAQSREQAKRDEEARLAQEQADREAADQAKRDADAAAEAVKPTEP